MDVLIINTGPKKNGATNRIIELLEAQLSINNIVRHICLGEKELLYCLGCKACHSTGICCQKDDVAAIVKSMYCSDAVIIVAPSYWAEVPGQMKVFIDRCTPYSNTNPNRIDLPHNTRGYAIVLRTGPGPAECESIIKSINHYFGHMEITVYGSTYLCNINAREDIDQQRDILDNFCTQYFPV